MERYFASKEAAGNGNGNASPKRIKKKSHQIRLTDCAKVTKLNVIEESKRVIDGVLVKLERVYVGLELEQQEEEQESDNVATVSTGKTRRLNQALRRELEKLERSFISLEVLEKTKVGRTVNRILKCGCVGIVEGDVKAKASDMIARWKQTAKAGKKARKESVNKVVPVFRRVT